MPTDRRLHILHVCDHLGWEGSRMHGVKRLFAWILPRFDPARYRVSLVSLRKRDLSEETLDALGIDITYLEKGKFDLSTLPALLRIIDEKRIDILHLHGYGATTFGRVAAAWRRLPVVLHEHANLTSTPWFQKVADRLLEPFTDVALAVSTSTAEFVTGARLVRPERVKVVYLGAPLDEFGLPRPAAEREETRASWNVTDREFVIGSVTRLHDSKGNEYLVRAARLVLDERPSARFIVFGEGPLRPSLEALAAELGIADRFTFAGFVTDVPRVLAAFDLSVFPSLWEGTPLTVFEAMAASRPIVATDADGLAEVLRDDDNALVIPRRDSTALARAIVRLIDDGELRARLAASARRSADHYDIAAFVRKMERLYEVLARESRPRRRNVAGLAELAFLTEESPT
jgi:glycosyltransferase involved in cell wall biosynthesis